MELYANVLPERTWPANTTQAISVRRRSGPLKQSKYEVPVASSCSRLFV